MNSSVSLRLLYKLVKKSQHTSLAQQVYASPFLILERHASSNGFVRCRSTGSRELQVGVRAEHEEAVGSVFRFGDAGPRVRVLVQWMRFLQLALASARRNFTQA